VSGEIRRLDGHYHITLSAHHCVSAAFLGMKTAKFKNLLDAEKAAGETGGQIFGLIHNHADVDSGSISLKAKQDAKKESINIKERKEKAVSEGDKGHSAPKWVISLPRCASYKRGKDRHIAICGVASCYARRNNRACAAGRARTEIARSLSKTLNPTVYWHHYRQPEDEMFGAHAADKQRLIDSVKQIVKVAIASSEMVDTWINNDGVCYALVVLKADKLKSAIANMKNLSEDFRAVFIERIDRTYTDCDIEIQIDKD